MTRTCGYEAVTQVQQACEKATKAILLANGTSYREVTDMGHNTIGAFVSFIAQTMGDNPIAGSVSDALLTNHATESALKIAKAVLSGTRNRERRNCGDLCVQASASAELGESGQQGHRSSGLGPVGESVSAQG